MEDRKSLLTVIAGFQGLDREDLEKLRAIIVQGEHKKGDLIFSDGQEGRGFFAVLRGQVKVYKMSPEGKEVILHVCGPGDQFGQAAMFGNQRYPAWAEALCASTVALFPGESFLELIGRYPHIALAMFQDLSSKLRQLTSQVEGLALKEVPGRLASYLVYLAEEQKSPGSIVLDTSKYQLASILGTTPETLSRILSDMTERNLITVDRREITLLDHDYIIQLAKQGRYGA
ncbi:Crp/Fnr family transcriptional regulator [Dethiosulfovibrio salsuginis]|uniref:Transcriptional regulator, Crp/Fnr family n=1 Tax=Dethiosulfovibrio salsuginis TaxID=561720 RepID=A0A1X7JEP4_9BACT|nr:Crp/Fnr family transcriptional regulator [Dethiosulfovibrio salsuginis]SMG26166.1 transcriptional regulator, Crp/Fnr family [Dethiosulfovibrio salsuginis]